MCTTTQLQMRMPHCHTFAAGHYNVFSDLGHRLVEVSGVSPLPIIHYYYYYVHCHVSSVQSTVYMYCVSLSFDNQYAQRKKNKKTKKGPVRSRHSILNFWVYPWFSQDCQPTGGEKPIKQPWNGRGLANDLGSLVQTTTVVIQHSVEPQPPLALIIATESVLIAAGLPFCTTAVSYLYWLQSSRQRPRQGLQAAAADMSRQRHEHTGRRSDVRDGK